MLGKISGIIIAVACFFGIVCGNTEKLAEAVISGAGDAVTLTVALVGMMCLWCGILQVLREAGAIRMLTKILRPVIKVFFPSANRHEEIAQDISANIAANMLGVGNAATPLALSAMEKLQKINPEPEKASSDMVTLAVLNTSSFSVVPSTVITIMRSEGSSNPFAVIVPIWITSVVCSTLSLFLCKIASSVSKIEIKRPKKSKIVEKL